MDQIKSFSSISWLGLAFWLGLTFAAGWVGSRFQPGEWYTHLVQPALTPPGWVFGPVWTILYILMGVAAWLVWQRYGLAGAVWPLGLFILQLVLNTLWSYLFFGLQNPGGAFLDIVALWLSILAAAHCLLAILPGGRQTPPPLPSLGNFCGLPELAVLAAEFLNFGLAGNLTKAPAKA